MDAADAPHETLRAYLRRTSRLGLLHTTADPPPADPGDAAPAIDPANGGAAAPPPPVRAGPLRSARRSETAGGGGSVFFENSPGAV